MAGPGTIIGLAGSDGDVLLEAGQGVVMTAGKPQGAKHENAFSVIHVVPHLADAPFVRRIPMQGPILRDATQEWKRFVQLDLQRADDIVAGGAVDVSEIIRSSFVGFGAANHVTILTAWDERAGRCS